MNVEKVLKKVDNLSRYEKDSLFSWGRQQVHAHLLEGEIEEGVRREFVEDCICMYVRQKCQNGSKTFEEWMADVYLNAQESQIKRLIDKTMNNLVYGNTRDFHYLRCMMRRKPSYININIKKLMEDVLDGNRYQEWMNTIVRKVTKNH